MSGFETLMFAAAMGGTVLETAGAMADADARRKIARNNAKMVQNEASEEARQASAAGRRLTSKAKVRAGASGLSVDGSALDVIAELEAEGEFNARSAIYRGRVRYDNFKAEEKNAKRAKYVALASGIAKLGTTALTAGMPIGGGEAAAATSSGTNLHALPNAGGL